MSPFDLLFILLFVAAGLSLLRAAGAAVRGQRIVVRSILRRLGLGVVAYLSIVVVVSLVSPRRFIEPGELQCSDDWCIAVTEAQRGNDPAGSTYMVTFEVSSRARRVVQRERNVVAWLRDESGRRYDAEPPGDEPAFDVRLNPGEVVRTRRVFRVPAGLRASGVVVAREGGVPMPGCCIIGDQGSLFHKKSVVRLERGTGP